MKRVSLAQAFPNGLPWVGEPDRVAFCEAGIECRIYRAGPLGHLCGYVKLPERHPWLIGEQTADVHGGITFGPSGLRDEEGTWVGFDCGHSGDVRPKDALEDRSIWEGEQYRDLAYVEAETRRLAAQVVASNTREVLLERALGHLPDWVLDALHLEWH